MDLIFLTDPLQEAELFDGSVYGIGRTFKMECQI